MMVTDPRQSGRPPVNSVVQAAAILRHLGGLSEGAGVNAVARAVGIGPSSCFNVLRTLVGEDLVAFDAVTKRYALGLGTIGLAQRALGNDAIVIAARQDMDDVATRHDAAVGLWRLAGSRLMLVTLAESESATRIHLVVGQRQPVSAGATGRAVLAARRLWDEDIRAAYEQVRWRRPPGVDTFLAQVRDATRRGWAEDLSDIHHGVDTVASVIADRGGAVRFVLSASIFGGREDAVGMARIGEAVRAAADRLARRVYGTERPEHERQA